MFKVTLWCKHLEVREYRVRDLQEAVQLVRDHTGSERRTKLVLELEDPKVWAVSLGAGVEGGWRVERAG